MRGFLSEERSFPLAHEFGDLRLRELVFGSFAFFLSIGVMQAVRRGGQWA